MDIGFDRRPRGLGPPLGSTAAPLRRWVWLLPLMWLSWCWIPGVAGAAPTTAGVLVAPVQVVERDYGAEVHFDLSGPTPHRVFALEDPPRLVVDLINARWRGRGDGLASRHWRRLRTGVRAGYDLRLVFDLVQPMEGRVALAAQGRRLIVQLTRPGGETMASPPQLLSLANAGGGEQSVTPRPKPSTPPAVPVPRPKPPRRRDFVVAIDPGHGGKDPGAIGAQGTYEKDVVLAVSRKLARLVDATPGMRAIMTRRDDRYLHLAERIDVARRQQADLFISIHADAFTRRSAQGASVYILSTQGASSTAARYLAKRENQSDLIGGGRIEVDDHTLAPVVFSIYHDAVLAESRRLADLLLARLGRLGKVHKPEVERAAFAVLKAPDIPSVLVELAFISNPIEERKLNDPRHQRFLAEALMTGLRDYHRHLPPERRHPRRVEWAAR
ncbi:MAG: N-acetylmuramoyl-L-alanine amidase [Candidatus Competibacterales bacterium]